MSAAGWVFAGDQGRGKNPRLTGVFRDAHVPTDTDEDATLPDGIEIAGYGVDTVSFCWRPQDYELWRHLERPVERGCVLQGWDEENYEIYASSEVMQGSRGCVIVKEQIGGGRVRYYPEHQMIYIEGRLTALLARNSKASGLVSPSRLAEVAFLSKAAVSDLLYPHNMLFEESFVRRLDLACDLRFADASQGRRFLRGLSALDVPRLRRVHYDAYGQLQTVNFCTPKGRTLLRIYDKASEQGAGEPGSLVRIEREVRFDKPDQLTPEAMQQEDFASMWQGQLKAWEGTEHVLIADLDSMERVIVDAVRDDSLSLTDAEKLLGHLRIREGVGRELYLAAGRRHLWSRRTRMLRDLGLVLDTQHLADEPRKEVLALGRILRAIRKVWTKSTESTSTDPC